jgi:thiol-disulfide isomerase/thioredoxin
MCILFLFTALSIPAKAEKLSFLASGLKDGKLMSLSNEPKSYKVVNFFWVECIPCAKELPELEKLARQHPHIKFYAVHAGADTQGERVSDELIEEYLGKLAGYPKPVYVTSPRVAGRLFQSIFPHTYIVNKDNKILAKFAVFNENSYHKLDKLLSALK